MYVYKKFGLENQLIIYRSILFYYSLYPNNLIISMSTEDSDNVVVSTYE